MRTGTESHRPLDPKVTEEFLLTQDDVVDASVWLDQGSLKAHVTLANPGHWTRQALRDACARQVGPRHTPEDFVLFHHRERQG